MVIKKFPLIFPAFEWYFFFNFFLSVKMQGDKKGETPKTQIDSII